MEPYFFSSRSYSEPESVAKSILTNKKSEITNGPALYGQIANLAQKLMYRKCHFCVYLYNNYILYNATIFFSI